MGHRRKARELAIQILYQIEMSASDPREVLDLFWKGNETPEETRRFAVELVEGTFRNRKEIDQIIEQHSIHWRLARMAVVDRNILRLAVYELLYAHDVPTNVALDEAIEIAKKFGTSDSSAFINGILDNVAKEIRR